MYKLSRGEARRGKARRDEARQGKSRWVSSRHPLSTLPFVLLPGSYPRVTLRLYNFISTVKHFALACRAHLQLLPVLALGCPAVNSPFFARPVIKFTAPLSISHTLKLQATRISMVLSLWAPLITISIIIYDFNFVQLLLAFLLIATSQLPVLLPTPAHTHVNTPTDTQLQFVR